MARTSPKETKLTLLVVGGGGREAALVRALARSPRTGRLLAAPGNPGMERWAECVHIAPADLDGFVRLARDRAVDLVVVGPEQQLVAGLSDRLTEARIPVVGPTREAARLEGSKVFAKELMTELHIPHAEPWAVFDDPDAACRYLDAAEAPLVVKADGLARGRGVVVARDRDEARAAAREMLTGRRFGDAGRRVVLEPRLEGDEVSLLFLCDGREALPLASARDYKRRGEGDSGPNTGGMGAHSPGHLVTPDLLVHVHGRVVQPLLQALADRGTPYRGVLYCGVMLTRHGVRVLEFNCRFGDPETQVILPRLRSDLVTLLEETARGSLAEARLSWDPRVSLAVVMASEGYPGSYSVGVPIRGLEDLEQETGGGGGDLFVDHSNTRRQGQALVTAGGRVLSVGALDTTLEAARARAYAGVARVRFEGAQWRPDIGAFAVRRGGSRRW